MLPTQQNTATKCIVYPGAEKILASVSLSKIQEIPFHKSQVGDYTVLLLIGTLYQW